jgi:alpha-L-fucosidase
MKPTGVCTHCRRLLLVLAAAIACAELQPVSAAQPDPESPAAREARLAWFREAKFGLFIHWGLYSPPAPSSSAASRQKERSDPFPISNPTQMTKP